MHIISRTRVKEAMMQYPQWSVGLLLWLKSFEQHDFKSFDNIKDYWKGQSGWNVDRVPARHTKGTDFMSTHFGLYVFDVHGTKCRVVTRINEQHNKLYIIGIFSHAEYDKWNKQNIIR